MSTFDAIVIGSGAGGSPVAQRLCARGMKVLLVERGKRYSRKDFVRDEIEWSRRDKFTPLLLSPYRLSFVFVLTQSSLLKEVVRGIL